MLDCLCKKKQHPIYMPKVNNRNPRTRCEICSKLRIKTPERRRRCSGGCDISKILNRDIPLRAIIDGIILINYLHLKFSLGNCLSISQPLQQLQKVSVRCHFQENLFGKFSVYYSVADFILVKNDACSIFLQTRLDGIVF